MSSALNIGLSTGNVGIGNRSYNDRVVPVSDGRINGVNITALNARTRTSAASTNAAISSWTTRTAPSNDWVSVCWSPELSLFVATSYAGTGNRIMTSTDGITWISQTSAADNIWWSVCWSSKLSLFVTVSTTGTGNRVMTSSNGINWSTRVSAADNNWNSVCWSDELTLFVSVAYSGTGNRVMTSSNGINWVTRASSVDSYWQSVCWAPELSMFIAVGYSTVNRGVMTSDNGINWITQVSTANNFWNTICWSSELSLFVTYSNSGTGNRIMTSSNGSSWTTRNSTADIDWRCVTWSPELSIFCAVAYTGASHRIAVSYDGIIWTSRSSALSPFQFICWAPELSIFAVSANAALTMTSAIGMPNSKSVVKALPSQMTVLANGNVGIGITNPMVKLDVAGDFTASTINGNFNFSAYYKNIPGQGATSYFNNLAAGTIFAFNNIIKQGTAVTKDANNSTFYINKVGTYKICAQMSIGAQGAFQTHYNLDLVILSGTLMSIASSGYGYCPSSQLAMNNNFIYTLVATTTGSIRFQITPNSNSSTQVREEVFFTLPMHSIQFMYLGNL